MDLLHQTKDRRLLFRMVGLSLATLILTVVLSLAMTVYVNRALADTYAGIVGTVAQNYPQVEAQVVRELSQPNDVSVALGHQVLERYGLQDLSAAQRGIGVGLLAILLPAGLALTGLTCVGFALLLVGLGDPSPHKLPVYPSTCARLKLAIMRWTCATTVKAASAC